MDVWIADPARDAARVATLRSVWARTSGATAAEPDDDFVDAVRDWWIRDERTVFLSGGFSRSGGGVSGMATLHEYRRMPMPGEAPSAWGYLGHLFVLPAARGEGHGRALIEAVQHTARGRVTAASSSRRVRNRFRCTAVPASVRRTSSWCGNRTPRPRRDRGRPAAPVEAAYEHGAADAGEHHAEGERGGVSQ